MVITGASSGIGAETAAIMAQAGVPPTTTLALPPPPSQGHMKTELQLGARVVLGCRNVTKGAWVAESILRDIPHADLDVLELDLASFDSVRTFAAGVATEYSSVDVLINNAGTATTCEATGDGHEWATQVGSTTVLPASPPVHAVG